MKPRLPLPAAVTRPHARLNTLVLTIVLLWGCESPDSGSDLVTLMEDDVRVVSTSELIAGVEDLDILPSGEVWVLNAAEPLFLGFTSEGSLAQNHGRLGGGPEEFNAPAGFVVGAIDGSAWILDQQRHRLIEVSSPESPRREFSFPEDEIPPGSVIGGMNLLSGLVRTARLGNEVIVPRRGEVSGDGIYAYWFGAWSADLVAFDPATGAARLLVPLRTVLGDPTTHVELSTGGLPPFPLWFRLWAVCSDDEVRVYDRFRNELRGFTRDGTEIDAISLPPPRYTEVTPQQFARAAFDLAVVEGAGAVTPNVTEMSSADSTRLINQFAQRVTATPEQIANILPRYADLRCAEDGTLWLRPLDLETGGLDGGPVWLQISRGGEVRNVRFPDGFDPYRFTTARVWGVQRNVLNVPSVAWIPAP